MNHFAAFQPPVVPPAPDFLPGPVLAALALERLSGLLEGPTSIHPLLKPQALVWPPRPLSELVDGTLASPPREAQTFEWLLAISLAAASSDVERLLRAVPRSASLRALLTWALGQAKLCDLPPNRVWMPSWLMKQCIQHARFSCEDFGRAATVIDALRGDTPRYTSIVHAALTAETGIEELLIKLGVPYADSALSRIREHLDAAIYAAPGANNADVHYRRQGWLCRHELERSGPDAIKHLEAVLRRVHFLQLTGERGLHDFALWVVGLRRDYPDLLSELSTDAANVVRNWIGLAGFRDFSRVVDAMRENQEDFELEGWEVNQLEKRPTFWSHYDQRIRRAKLFLPAKTYDLLKYMLPNELQFENIVRTDDALAGSEVCLLDVDGFILIEHFRGSAEIVAPSGLTEAEIEQAFSAEARIPPRPPRYRWTQDHRFLWQPALTRRLVAEGIEPNPGITHFKGMASSHARYVPGQGLPMPDDAQLRERASKLRKSGKRPEECPLISERLASNPSLLMTVY